MTAGWTSKAVLHPSLISIASCWWCTFTSTFCAEINSLSWGFYPLQHEPGLVFCFLLSSFNYIFFILLSDNRPVWNTLDRSVMQKPATFVPYCWVKMAAVPLLDDNTNVICWFACTRHVRVKIRLVHSFNSDFCRFIQNCVNCIKNTKSAHVQNHCIIHNKYYSSQ